MTTGEDGEVLREKIARAIDDALPESDQLTLAPSQIRHAADAVLALIEPVMEENERLREALTPSADTKAAYIGEFSFSFPIGFDDDGHDVHRIATVPWCTIKEIMAAIQARAALSPKSEKQS
jgi:hypothetical protein